MKNIHVEKRSHLPQLSFPMPPSLSCSLSLRKHFPTEEWKMREALWFQLERQGFFIEESIATTTKKKSTREEEHFLSAYTTGLLPFLLLWEWNQGLGLQLLQSSLPPVLSGCPSQPYNDTRKPNLLLCYWPTTCVTSHQQRTLRHCPLPGARTDVRRWARGAQRWVLCLVERQVQL